MDTRMLGNTGIEISAVGLGTWAIGGGPWWGDSDDDESVRAIHAALDAGVNLVDTAPVYAYGHSEEVVGRAIAGRRDKVVLATKAGLWWRDRRGETFFVQGGIMVRRSLRPETIAIEIEDSLRRLRTDYIDLYQTHWQAPEEDPVPVEDTMACLMRLKDQGKIRAIGASNTTPAIVDEYLAAGPLASVQERYSLLDRRLDEEAVPLCRERGVAILAYSPLEQGILAGAVDMDTAVPPGQYRNFIPWYAPENRRKVLDMLAGWSDLTEKYDCTLAQLVIAWTISRPGITSALCGARKERHATANARGGDIALEAADARRMLADARGLGSPVFQS